MGRGDEIGVENGAPTGPAPTSTRPRGLPAGLLGWCGEIPDVEPSSRRERWTAHSAMARVSSGGVVEHLDFQQLADVAWRYCVDQAVSDCTFRS